MWQNDLDKKKLSEMKRTKTLICYVKSSGNQSGRNLRETAIMSADEYSKVTHFIQKDIIITGT